MAIAEHLEGLLCAVDDRRRSQRNVASIEDGVDGIPVALVDELGIGAILGLVLILYGERRGDQWTS